MHKKIQTSTIGENMKLTTRDFNKTLPLFTSVIENKVKLRRPSFLL